MRRLATPGLCATFALLVRAQVTPASTDPIPNPKALFEEVRAHQRQTDEIRENYTFHEIRQIDDLDGSGAVRNSNSYEREVFFVNGHRVGRLVRKNGVELNAAEERNEQDRVRKMVEKHMKSAPLTGRGGGVRLIGDILAVAKVSSPRRISLNDRNTIVFDFAGDPDAGAHGFDQEVAKKMAGSVWIDEADRQVARLEVRFDRDLRIGGGLLGSLKKGTTIKVEQSPVGDGLWMQTASEQFVAARIIVKGLRENIHIKDFDFKKFNVETIQQVKPPSP